MGENGEWFMFNLKNNRIYSFIKEMVTHFIHDDVPGLSAQLAYYFLLSIFPFLIFSVALLGYLPISTKGVLEIIEQITPGKVTEALENTLGEFLNIKRGGLLFFSFVGTIWTASSGINALIWALNKAYDVPQERAWWLTRIMSILFTFGMVVAILITLLLPVFGKIIEVHIIQILNLNGATFFIWSVIRWVVSLVFLTLIFGLLYYFAPNRKVPWKHVFIGAGFASIGWIIVSFGFSFYVNSFANYSIMYGSLGGVIVLMTWFYLSAMIIIVGGQINAMIERKKT